MHRGPGGFSSGLGLFDLGPDPMDIKQQFCCGHTKKQLNVIWLLLGLRQAGTQYRSGKEGEGFFSFSRSYYSGWMRDEGAAQSCYIWFGEAREKLWVMSVWNDGIVRDVTANVKLPAPAPDKVYALQGNHSSSALFQCFWAWFKRLRLFCMWAVAKHDNLANSEEILSKETQLGSRDRSPAVAFSNCCWLGYLAMATGGTKWRLVEDACHLSVAQRRSEMRLILKHYVKK